MATAYKVLGQSSPTAATLTTLYTVPALTSTIVSSIVATNINGTTPDVISIAVRPAGASITNAMYITYNVTVPAYSNYVLQVGVTLATTDVISVYSTNGTTSFSTFGSELS
jgi:hypothetical protein